MLERSAWQLTASSPERRRRADRSDYEAACERTGLPLETLRVAGLKGKGGATLLRNLAMLLPAMLDARRVLRRHQPVAAFGVGGYAAGPMLLATWLGRVPNVIFEPNAEPGFTNRVLATIPVGIHPQDIAWAPDGRFAYVVNEGTNNVSVIDVRTNRVTATIPTGIQPTSIAVLPNGRQAYVSNLTAGTLTVLDLTG